MSAPKLEEMVDATGGERIGYARVSTDEQSLDLQVNALERIKCLRIFTEKLSATAKRRPELDEAIKNLRPGDTFIVWRLDRLARGLPELLKRLDQISAKGAGFLSLMERFDFSTATGKLILHILGTVADFERNLTIERTIAGLAAARARGVKFGTERPMTVTIEVCNSHYDLLACDACGYRWERPCEVDVYECLPEPPCPKCPDTKLSTNG